MTGTVYFSVGEQEIIRGLEEVYDITHLEAVETFMIQKRELAFLHFQRGNLALAKHLLQELDEWNSETEELFKRSPEHNPEKPKTLLRF